MIEAVNIRVVRGKRVLLDDVSVTASAGQFVAVIGPNGAGKSTLLSVLAGLTKPDAGTVTLDGVAVAAWSGRALAARRAYLPQSPHLEWPLPVQRLVALGLTPQLPPLGPLPDSFMPAIDRALAACDLTDRRHQPATTLSGGEFARAMLARAIVGNPAILIVDEPVTGLDPRHAMAMMALLTRQAGSGTLVIASLHDLTLTARHADRILALVDGRLVAATDSLTESLIHRVFDVTVIPSGQGNSRSFTILSTSEK